MAAERVTVGRTTAGRATAKREAADGLEKRAETNWKLALSSVGGVSWVGAGWGGDRSDSMDCGDKNGGGVDGNRLSCEGGVRRRLISSSPSLSSSASHRLFLVLLAGGKVGGGGSVGGDGSAEGAVGAMTGMLRW
jgi:hypothetical protein